MEGVRRWRSSSGGCAVEGVGRWRSSSGGSSSGGRKLLKRWYGKREEFGECDDSGSDGDSVVCGGGECDGDVVRQ